MKKQIKGVLVNTQTNEIKPYSFEYEEDKHGKTTFLPNMYALLNCDCIDIAAREFGGYTLDIVCDDEGLFKENNKVSIVTLANHELVEQIVGNVFICNANDEGETISLTEKETEAVLKTIISLSIGNEQRKVLVARV